MRRPWRQFGTNLRSLFGWRDARRDVTEEMSLHVELRVEELEARGVPRDEAQRIAMREVGAADLVGAHVQILAGRTDRSSSVRQRGEELLFDVRHAVRLFRRTPGFSLIAVLTIGLGLGANAAIFALVNTLFLRPLPFDPDGNLVRVREFRQTVDGTRNNVDASRRTADAVAGRDDLFTSSVAVIGTHRTLITDDGPTHVQGTRVGPGFLGVASVAPVLGRGFTRDEESAGDAAGAALISHRLWRSAFGGRTSIVGERLRLDEQSYEIVGVLPPAFHVPYDSDVWFPSRFADSERSVFILARLAPGVSFESAVAALEPLGTHLNAMYPEVMRGLGVTAVRARDYFVDDDGQVALALMGAVAFLLLIGCANVALLLTTRFASRRREVAVRAALGCGRGRQVRQFVTESLLLFVLGGGLGLLLASWLAGSLVVFLPEAIASQVGIQGIAIDGRVVLFAGLLSVCAGLLFGLIAATRATRADLHSIMKDAGRSVAGSNSGTLRGLAASEVALALVLLTSAAMMADTFRRLQERDLGFEPNGVLTVQAGMEAQRYASAASRLSFIDGLLERVRSMPGVEAAGVTTVNPLCCGDWGARIAVEGETYISQEQLPLVQHQLVTPGYFETMRMHVVRGRTFTEEDREGREPVVVIDERAAKRFWPGEDPVGRRLKRGSPDRSNPWLTVIGVVKTIEDQGEYTEAWYLPYAQHAVGPSSATLHFMVRAADPSSLIAPIRTAGAELDTALALHDVTTMDGVQSERLQQNRLGAIVTWIFAGAGLFLAALGLYGVLSFVLAADTREIGVRLALGARPAAIVRLIAGRASRLVSWGMGAGMCIAMIVGITLERVLPEARLEAWMVAASSLALACTAGLAMLVPIARALRLDPLTALRHD